jgi:hypothetical protein
MKWEYWSCRIEIDPQVDKPVSLNAVGAEGWELVAIVPVQNLPHQFRGFFKRPVEAGNSQADKNGKELGGT